MRSAPRRLTIALLLITTGGLAHAGDTPIATKGLAVIDRPGSEDVTGRKVRWTAKDAAVLAGGRGTADDPRCAPAGGGAGGTLRIFSDRSAGSTEDTGDVVLPCANWKAIGSATTPNGFVYADADQSDGPCTKIAVTSGRGVKATCTGKRAPLDYDLMPGIDQGDVGVVLRVGLDDRFCASADATNGRDGSDGRIFNGRNAPAPATCPVPFVCGDSITVPGEECDDGNTVAADGCSPQCTYEPLCLVTRDGGNPSHASLAKITRDGTVTPMGGATLPGDDTFGRQTLARCGRRVYFNLREAIAGLEVGLDGTLTPLPSFLLTEPGQIDTIDDISCSPIQDLVITLEAASLFFGQATSYRVDAVTGALTQAGRVQTERSSFAGFHSDFHPVTHELYFATIFDPPLGVTPLQAHLGRIVYDALGNLSLAQQYTTQPGFLTPTSVDGIAFTRDASALVVFSFFDGTQTCFGQFDAPGPTLPPIAALAKTCSGPLPVNDRWFVPRPEGGPIFYFAAGGSLFTGVFDPPSFDVASSLAGVTEGKLLLGFDGRVIVLLNAVDGTVRTYEIASDLMTVTPNDSAPLGASPRDGVLLPCPEL